MNRRLASVLPVSALDSFGILEFDTIPCVQFGGRNPVPGIQWPPTKSRGPDHSRRTGVSTL